jgi:ATP-dependent RNA helicase RhlE
VALNPEKKFSNPPAPAALGALRQAGTAPMMRFPVGSTILTQNEFSELGLQESLLRALSAENYQHPTPIQTRSIPPLLAGKDLLGIAQTGTGKTAAFGLPILQNLAALSNRPAPRSPRALILAPTRELAIQIGQALRNYGRHLSLRHAVIFGGVGQKPQVDALRRGVDIVVATPGRLLDLMNQQHLRLDKVVHFVLDEADRMLDMGFIHDVKKIVAALPKRRQTMFFSATMPNAVSGLAGAILRDPVQVAVTPSATPVDRIKQSVFFVEGEGKRALLADILKDPALERIIIFTRTKHRANRVADQLDRIGVTAQAIHGNKSQNARQRALEAFRKGKSRVLVATDIAARGIDIDGVTHVINYELPNVAEDYVHRIGRTARAGASGASISLCDPSEQAYLRAIESLTKNRLTVAGGEPARHELKPANANRRGGNSGKRRRPQRSRRAA